jgi:isoleucyl-tRNA synthetase
LELCISKQNKAVVRFLHTKIIEDELNVKEVIFTDDVRDFTSYSFKPQRLVLKYGKQLGGIQKTLSESGWKQLPWMRLKEKGVITS